MRLQGLVSLVLLATSSVAVSQEPLPLPPEPARQIGPELSTQPLPTGPTSRLRSPSAVETSSLESELEALRADLESFHALSDEVTRSTRNAETDAERALHRQRQEMLDILTKLATQGISQKPVAKKNDKKPALANQPVAPVIPDAVETQTPAVTDAAVDNFALGKVLFRAGDYVKAEQAFRKVVQTDDNRLMVKYLIATCLRKRSQWSAAIEAYKEIAASEKDPVLRDLAKFQLDGIRWTQDTEKQIEQLKKQRANPARSKL
ncbi:MAG: CDC27 family protein [Planctomycetota bacterium]